MDTLLSIFAAVVLGSTAPDQTAQSARPVVDRTLQRWGVDEGLPNNALTSVLQTRDGYLWIGSWAGIVRFDGVRFTPIATNLPNIHVRALLEDRDGSVWIGTIGGGVSHWRSGSTETFTTADGLANNYVRAMAQDRRGRIWVTTDGGLSRIVDGRVTSWTANDADFAGGLSGIGVGTEGDVIVATARHVCVMDDDQPRCDASQPFPRPAAAFFSDREGHQWIAAARAGVFETDGHGVPAGPCAAGCLPGTSVSAFAQARDGAIWVGFSDGRGAARLRNGTVTMYPPALGVPPYQVESLVEDAEGSIWLAPSTGGLVQLRPTRVTAYSMRDGLPATAAASVAQDLDGTIWAGASCGPVSSFTGERFETRFVAAMHGLCARVVLASRDGALWIGTTGAGVFADGTAETFTHFGAEAGLAELNVNVLFEDTSGVLWTATNTQLYRLVGGHFQRVFGATEGPGGSDVVSLAEDSKGRIWIGSNGHGLSVYEHGAFRAADRDVALPTSHVAALIVDSHDDLWIGTADRGVFRFRKGHVDRFGVDEGLNDRLVALLIEDARGDIWVPTTRGIARLERARIEAVANGTARQLDPVFLDRADGLIQTEGMGGGFDPSGLRARDGRLWFSTVAGLVVVDPSTFPVNTVSSRPMIESVLIDGAAASRDAAGTITVPAGAETVEFSYTAFSFLVPSRVRFEYRLAGAESVWHGAGVRRVAAYNRIPPGRYTFEVRATNSNNVWSSVPGAVQVVVLPRIWERRSVQGAAVLWLLIATGVGVNAVARSRARRRVDELERDQTLMRERSRIARDLHDDLGSRLAQIALMADAGAASPALTRISTTARDAMQTMDELVWTVNAKNDTVESFTAYAEEFAEEHLGLAGVRVRLQIQADFQERQLSADARRHLFLAFKEAIHNIVKHAGATEVRIALHIENDALVLHVVDNGCGLPTGQPAGMGNGVRNMHERMRLAGGDLRVESSPGQGMKIAFRLPLK